ncbi:hypothetical protein [Arthrobacter oryzae]|uniref:hypothetical protein n=1 Tax=Arthrobacter oryzae TaxID=409290 RepID=UPI00273C4C03|nr:hypothetical protein [Arthrobacter oryzae]WLQ08050.1 hypothetical protein Q8Z05_07870 [Arthrobacter oryzae]
MAPANDGKSAVYLLKTQELRDISKGVLVKQMFHVKRSGTLTAIGVLDLAGPALGVPTERKASSYCPHSYPQRYPLSYAPTNAPVPNTFGDSHTV